MTDGTIRNTCNEIIKETLMGAPGEICTFAHRFDILVVANAKLQIFGEPSNTFYIPS
jgi:hypothetical protein